MTRNKLFIVFVFLVFCGYGSCGFASDLYNEISMSLKITPTAMNMPQHYSQREKSVRTLTSDNSEQACAARGEKVRCRSLSPIGEKQVITPCKAIAVARGRENRRHLQNSVGVQHLSFMLRLSQKAKDLTEKG